MSDEKRSMVVYGYEDPMSLISVVERLPMSSIKEICETETAVLVQSFPIDPETKKITARNHVVFIDVNALVDYVAISIIGSVYVDAHNCAYKDPKDVEKINERARAIMEMLNIGPSEIMAQQYKSTYMTMAMDEIENMDEYSGMSGEEFLTRISREVDESRNEFIKKMIKSSGKEEKLDPKDIKVHNVKLSDDKDIHKYAQDGINMMKNILEQVTEELERVSPTPTTIESIKSMNELVLTGDMLSNSMSDEDNFKVVKFIKYAKERNLIPYWLPINSRVINISAKLADMKLTNEFSMNCVSIKSKTGFVKKKCRIVIEQFVVDHMLYNRDIWKTDDLCKSFTCHAIPRINMSIPEYLKAIKSRSSNNTIIENPDLARKLKRVRSGVILAMRTITVYAGKSDKPYKQITQPVVYWIRPDEKEDKDAKRTNMGKDNMEKS